MARHHVEERWDSDTSVPHYNAIMDDDGRIMVFICHNTDLVMLGTAKARTLGTLKSSPSRNPIRLDQHRRLRHDSLITMSRYFATRFISLVFESPVCERSIKQPRRAGQTHQAGSRFPRQDLSRALEDNRWSKRSDRTIVDLPFLRHTLSDHWRSRTCKNIACAIGGSNLPLGFSTHSVHTRPYAADITGTEILEEHDDGRRRMNFVKGPIFANVLLADEINRTPPKTQAALLEAMQEHQVTVAGQRYALEEPFFVLATQNPIEMEGTYPLPEAQLDRFMFNVYIDYLPYADELEVVLRTTSRSSEPIEPLFTAKMCKNFTRLFAVFLLPNRSQDTRSN